MLRRISKNKMTLKKILKKVKADPNRLVFFFDEGRFGLRSTVMRCWARRGEPLNVQVKQGFNSFYIYSSVSPVTGDNFTLFLPEVNTEMMNIYLDELSKACGNTKLLLIMDCAGWHKSKELMLPKNIKVEFLPPYSPELNPVERLWYWLKKEAVHNNLFESLSQLMDRVSEEYLKLTKKRLTSLCNCSYI